MVILLNIQKSFLYTVFFFTNRHKIANLLKSILLGIVFSNINASALKKFQDIRSM